MAAGLFEKETAEVDFKENVLEHGGDEAALAIAELDSIEQTPVARFVWLVTITCSVAGALFGCMYSFTPLYPSSPPTISIPPITSTL